MSSDERYREVSLVLVGFGCLQASGNGKLVLSLLALDVVRRAGSGSQPCTCWLWMSSGGRDREGNIPCHGENGTYAVRFSSELTKTVREKAPLERGAPAKPVRRAGSGRKYTLSWRKWDLCGTVFIGIDENRTRKGSPRKGSSGEAGGII